MSKHIDKLKGGIADKKQPKDFDKDQLAVGIAHEMEHTNNKTIAQEIAMDHLSEDAEYYKKLKAVEKYDRVEITPDGKIEPDYGKEKLDKKPMTKSMLSRWELIKKDLDNKDAILDLSTLSEPEEDEEQSQMEGDQEMDPNAEEQDDGGSDEEDNEESEDSGRPEWLPDHMSHDDEQPEMEEQEGDSGEEDQGGDEEGEQELVAALKDMGHSDAEIAHIVHGHMTPPVDEAKRAKAHAEYAGIDHDKEAHDKEMQIRDQEAQTENDHAKRMKDVEYERAQKESGETDLDLQHKKRLQDLEYQKAAAESKFNEAAVENEHKKRMLDLEYETAKKQQELELQFKVKEHEMKLKHGEELARQKHKDQMQATKETGKAKLEDNKTKIAQKRAESKKLKKDDEGYEEELEKGIDWKFNSKTGQLSHPEHGFIAVNKMPGGGYEIKHNGTNLGQYSPEHIKDAITYHTNTIGKDVAYNPMVQRAQKPPTIIADKATMVPNRGFKPTAEPPQINPLALENVKNKYGKLYNPDLSGTIDYKKKGIK